MKTRSLNNQRGIALIVVLVFLVLLSIFIIGFFSNSQDELTAAQSFTGEVSASHLAESAVSVVMGQIREATSRPNGAWGSQPGMIRVYRDGNNASPKADAFFKLYSSDDMIISGSEISSFNPANDVVEGPNGWEHAPALWTNLNEEVNVPLTSPNGTVTTVSHYPILDPSLDGQIEGLELPPKDFVPNGVEQSSALKKARMPVKWLYVLKDGTLTAPSSSAGNGTQAIWKKGQREPTAANPIVGRVAFWTDDECCKVNVNTAGGYTLMPEDAPKDGGMPKADARGNLIDEDDYAGTFWDTPRTLTVFDRGLINYDGQKTTINGTIFQSDGSLDRGGLALSQPVRGEFQRYPGHPSTTSLGIIFRGRKTGTTSMQDAPYLLKSGQIALLAPRLMFSLTNRNDRASNYGTDRLLSADYRNDPAVQSNDQPVTARVKRLYASVDELFYAQPDKPPGLNRKQNDWELGVPGVSQNDATKVLTAEYLEKMRFFLTAYSRAPEVNLFGQPRVTIWPVAEVTGTGTAALAQEADLWNASDRLIAFCSTIGPDASKLDERLIKRYLFQRTDPYSASNDIGLRRNQDILRYLRTITSQPFPGFGGISFEAKYRDAKFGGDNLGREQILTEIFDYIRTVNLRDSTRDKDINTKYPPATQAKNNTLQKEKYKYAPRGLVVPAVSTEGGTDQNARHGFGRFPTISEASIVLYVSGYVGTDNKRYWNSRKIIPTDLDSKRVVLDRNLDAVLIDIKKDKNDVNNQVKVKDKLIRAFFITETFNPMQGYAPTSSPSTNSLQKGAIVYEIQNLDQFKINGKSLAMPPKATNDVAYSSGNLWGGRNSGGPEGVMHTLWTWPDGRAKGGVSPGVTGLAGGKWYPFQSDPTDVAMLDPVDPASGITGVPIPYGSTDPNGPGNTYPVNKTLQLQGPNELKIKMYYGDVLSGAIRDLNLKGDGGFGIGVDVPMPTDELWSVFRGDLPAAGNPTALGRFIPRYGGGMLWDKPEPGYAPVTSDKWACNWGDPNSNQGGKGIQFYSTGARFSPEDRFASPRSFGDWVDPKETNATKRIKPGRLTWAANDATNYNGTLPLPGPNYDRRWNQILQPGDVVRSVVYGNPKTGKGDLRISCIAVDTESASSVFVRHPDYEKTFYSTADDSTLPSTVQVPVMHAQSLRMADTQLYYPDRLISPLQHYSTTVGTIFETRFGNVAQLPPPKAYPASQAADLPPGFNGVRRIDGKVGDFDTGIGSLPDGPFCNKADEGNLAFRHANYDALGKFDHWDYPIPYFTWVYEETFETFFTPNRQTPSPVVFGSLLSGKGTDWQTLCFSPNPIGTSHPGLIDPKDYLWLDLFNMPVVEPYAISEPFSTAGKINLNYPLIPFPHIKRTTGLRAALQPVRVTAFPTTDVSIFKSGGSLAAPGGTTKYGGAIPANSGGTNINYRYLVDRDETLKGFDDFFAKYATDHSLGFIKSGAQICDFFLYPRQKGKVLVAWSANDAKIKTWWNQYLLTGDNVREKPYGDLYPRITTKSNTFCVHIRAQALRQSAASDPTQATTHYLTWDEKRDRVIGEYRGSSIIERYIDPQDSRFDPSSTTNKASFINPDTTSIDNAYRFRVLSTKRFDP